MSGDFGFWILDFGLGNPDPRSAADEAAERRGGPRGETSSVAVRKSKIQNPKSKIPSGFTLAELIVATTVLTVVMTAVYTAFGSTIRAWRVGESQLHVFQDARTALSVMSHELGCVLGGTEHLFQGGDDEFEFFTVTPPMNVDKGEGPRVMWVQYRFNRTGHTLVRQEALVTDPLPLAPRGEDEVDHSRIKMGRKYKFEIARNVRDFAVTYYWIPPVKTKPGEPPPQWVPPVTLKRSEEGWGLPQGIRVDLTIQDDTATGKETTFTLATAFRGPTTPYNEHKIGGAEEFE